MTSAMTSTQGRELVVGWFAGKRKESGKGKGKTRSDRSLRKKAVKGPAKWNWGWRRHRQVSTRAAELDRELRQGCA